MIKTIRIGEREVSLEANAATGIRYKQIFGQDILKKLAKMETDIEKIDAINDIARLAYVMNRQSTKSVKEASEDDFIGWMECFEEQDFQDKDTIIEILSIWNRNFANLSQLKNEQSHQ